MLGTNLEGEYEDEGEDGDDADDDRVMEIVGKVRLVVKWLPVVVGGGEGDGGVLLTNEEREGSMSSSSTSSLPSSPADGGTNGLGLGPASGPAFPTLATTATTPSNAASPRPAPAPVPTQAGILAIRVAYTKLDYGDIPSNPILALHVGANPSASSMSTVAAATAAALSPSQRLVCMAAAPGGRPGLLHWGKVFHIPVWNPVGSRAVLELGDAASSLKLSSFGPELYQLDALDDFESDVAVEATASIPLNQVCSKGVVRGTWRLREARRVAGVVPGGHPGSGDEHLDVGRAALVMAWFPLA